MSAGTVIVGASIGGVRTAQSLRSEGYEKRIVLVSDESEMPYDRPPLSKAFLQAADIEPSPLVTEAELESEDVQLLLGHAAVGADLAAQRVHLRSGQDLEYETLVIATGASPRPSPWGEMPGIHVLRTLEDARRLRAELHLGGQLVVIGAGFIGAEVSATARGLGVDVTLIDPLPVPMSRIFNEEVGQWFNDLHRSNGVTTLFGIGVERIGGRRGEFTLHLTDGSTVGASSVLVGIGVTPNDKWLAASGLLLDDGVVLNEYCQAVDAPNVFAVGDVARWHHRRHGADMRVEHWTNAVEQAACVAYNITHAQSMRSYEPVEYVWSDQHDWRIQVVGRVGGHLQHIVVGHPEVDGKFMALYTENGEEVNGAAIVNWPKALLACRLGMRRGASVGEILDKVDPRAEDAVGDDRQ